MATRRRTTTRIEVSEDRGVFMISVAAELADMHPQTLRMYEARGLISPQRSPKGTRLYSHEELERVRRSFRAEIVPYRPPGEALIPARAARAFRIPVERRTSGSDGTAT